MANGWIRAYAEEDESVKTRVPYFNRHKRAEFRLNFTTALRASASETSHNKRNLKWGDELELPTGLGNTEWTEVQYKNISGEYK